MVVLPTYRHRGTLPSRQAHTLQPHLPFQGLTVTLNTVHLDGVDPMENALVVNSSGPLCPLCLDLAGEILG